MGAFWYLFSPLKITATINKDSYKKIEEGKSLLPEPFCKDFLEVNRKEEIYEQKMSDGTYTSERIKITYMLSDENLLKLKPFLKDVWEMINKQDSSAINRGFDEFIKDGFDSLEISRKSMPNLEDELREIRENYFLRYDSILEMYIYNGWPDELISREKKYVMSGLIFLNSYEKMNVIPEETVLFYNLKDKIKEVFSSKYAMAKYVCTLGY